MAISMPSPPFIDDIKDMLSYAFFIKACRTIRTCRSNLSNKFVKFFFCSWVFPEVGHFISRPFCNRCFWHSFSPGRWIGKKQRSPFKIILSATTKVKVIFNHLDRKITLNSYLAKSLAAISCKAVNPWCHMKPRDKRTVWTFKTGIDKCVELTGMVILVRIFVMTGCTKY